MRQALRTSAERMRAGEVDRLCGPSHHPPADNRYRRAGSELGKCYAEGNAQALRRPRVRGPDGQEYEHVLVSCAAMSQGRLA